MALKTDQSLLELYTEMLRIRRIEERIADRYPEQKMRCPVHLSIGQEAIAVGVCKAALQTDFLVSNHRAHAHYLAKGGNLKAMIAEIYGKSTGCVQGRGGSMHLYDSAAGIMGSTPIIGSTMPVGVGIAFASTLKKEERAMIIFLGDAATEEGVFSECLNFAVLKQLPILFVCENNFFSVYSPLSVRQPKNRDLLTIVRGHGMWADSGYGNDVGMVHAKARGAFQRIREKQGPCFLEFTTYRYREHVGPYFDNHLNYRSEQEYEEWKKRCPVHTTLAQLRANDSIDDQVLADIDAKIALEIDEAFAFAEASPFPDFCIEEPIYSP